MHLAAKHFYFHHYSSTKHVNLICIVCGFGVRHAPVDKHTHL